MKTQKLTLDQLHQDAEVIEKTSLNNIKGGNATYLNEDVFSAYTHNPTPDSVWPDQVDTSGMIYRATPAPDKIWPDRLTLNFQLSQETNNSFTQNQFGVVWQFIYEPQINFYQNFEQ